MRDSFVGLFSGSHSAFFPSLKPPVEEWGHPQWAGHAYINQQLRQFPTDKPTDKSDPCNPTIDDSLLS